MINVFDNLFNYTNNLTVSGLNVSLINEYILNYFSKYNEEFKYSDERCKESKEIIKLIDNYTKCQDELNSKMPVVTYYEENNKIIKNQESD